MPPTADQSEVAVRAAKRADRDIPEMAAATDEALLARVATVSQGIIDGEEMVAEGYAERLNLYRVLASRGIPQRTIGDSAQVSANAVGYALHTHGREIPA